MDGRIAQRVHYRRAPSQVQQLVLTAAHHLFTTQGYHGTKTREIAERAGVGEPVIFRNFGSKAQLFEEAILKPFVEFIDDWAAEWERKTPKSADPEVITRTFVKGFYAVVAEHRELLRTLNAARAQGGDGVLNRIATEVSHSVAESLQVMRKVLLEHGEALHYQHLDPPVSVAIAAGSVMSLVLFDDWIFPAHERRPSKARQIDELSRMLLHGIAHRP